MIVTTNFQSSENEDKKLENNHESFRYCGSELTLSCVLGG